MKINRIGERGNIIFKNLMVYRKKLFKRFFFELRLASPLNIEQNLIY